MQSIDTFNSNLSVAIALVGGAGSGKTSLALTLFPGVYAFVSDLNFQSGLRWYQDRLSRGLSKPGDIVGFDTASPDETGKIIPPLARFDRMLKCISAAHADPKVDVVVCDSGTFMEDIIKARICSATTENAIKLTGFDQWGALVLAWKSIIMQCRQSGKKTIFTFHENKEKDESDQIFKYQIAVDGSIRGKLPALFSDVWRCEVAEANGKHTWNLRTLGNVRQEHLKNTYGLPGLLTQDEVVKLVRAAK